MLLIRNAEIGGIRGVDARCRNGIIDSIARGLVPEPGEIVIDARGGALLPGLHDHHIHLRALAAARRSLKCGPPEVTDRDSLQSALRRAPGTGWVRGVGYHESVSGELTAAVLDALLPDRPVRIQHRSGKIWYLNTLAARSLGLDPNDTELFRRDDWLHGRIPETEDDAQAVAQTAALLASYGVTGITDTTPSNDAATRDWLEGLALPLRVTLMGAESLGRGPLKVMLDDYALPDADALCDRIRNAHAHGRSVAVHCVTRTELVFGASILATAGSTAADRIEHAAVTDDAAMALLRRAGVTVVTQPNLIAERGDQYLADVPAADQRWLYRCRGFLDAGVPLGGGTDAPFGDPDPWAAMHAAVARRTRSGPVIGPGETLSPERAIALFTTPPDAPGGAPRRVTGGEAADLCLLDRGWAEARERLRHDDVTATIVAGKPVYLRADR